MRNLFFITLLFQILISLNPLFSSKAMAQINPWPWAQGLPFPWAEIEGKWAGPTSKFQFSIEVIYNASGIRHLKIKQLDPKNPDRVVASGQGYEQGNNIVVAAMTGGTRNQYLLTIRLLKRVYCSSEELQATGLTMETLNHELLNQFFITKIDESTLTPLQTSNYKHSDPIHDQQGKECLLPPEGEAEK